MKHLRLFENKAAYESALPNIATPYVAYSIENKEIFFGGGKILTPANVGDIIYVANGEKKWVAKDEWNDSLGTPIGVCVIPASHCDNGENGIMMSLANMSLKTPEVGSLAVDAINGDNYMMWGKYGTDLPLTNFTQVPSYDPSVGIEASTISMDGNGHLPSDFFPLHDDTCVMSNDGIAGYDMTKGDDGIYQSADLICVPSPYMPDGSKCEKYFQGALSDMDGKANTQVILNAIGSQYLGGATVENVQDAYPAANCCSRFHTEGTSQGDWYLPSIGQLGYLYVRVNKINEALVALGNKAVQYGFMADAIYGDASKYGCWSWASTEYSGSSAWGLYTSTDVGSLYRNYKTSYNLSSRVRAFCAF